MGQIIAHHAIPNPCCPIKALTACIIALLKHGASPKNIYLCLLQPAWYTVPNVSNDDIVHAIQATLPFNQEATPGYLPKLVRSHSLLCAGGAMALFLNSFDASAIMKIGCWTSTAFMSYNWTSFLRVHQNAWQLPPHSPTWPQTLPWDK